MNTTDKELLTDIYNRLIAVHLEPPSLDYMQRMSQIIDAPDDQAGMLTAFRHAANSIAVEAGVIMTHVGHGEASASVAGNHLHVELISESELRFRRMSVKYERLRAAAIPVADDHLGDGTPCGEATCTICALKEALNDDR